jgi:hypothetical protein
MPYIKPKILMEHVKIFQLDGAILRMQKPDPIVVSQQM